MNREVTRNKAFDKAGQEYRGALLTILGSKEPDIGELLDRYGIAFALRVLQERRVNADILRKHV